MNSIIFKSFIKVQRGFGVSADRSKELWHSIDFNFTFFIDIESSPECWEIGSEVGFLVCFVEMEMGVNNLITSFFGIFLSNPEVSRWKTSTIFTFGGIGGVHALHEGIISFSLESIWGISDVSLVSSESIHVGWEFFSLNGSFIIRAAVAVGIIVRVVSLNVNSWGSLISREFIEPMGINLFNGKKSEKGSDGKIFH